MVRVSLDEAHERWRALQEKLGWPGARSTIRVGLFDEMLKAAYPEDRIRELATLQLTRPGCHGVITLD